MLLQTVTDLDSRLVLSQVCYMYLYISNSDRLWYKIRGEWESQSRS